MGEVFAERYELIDVLEGDGFGQVWRAWDREQDAVCMARVVTRPEAGDLERLLTEHATDLQHSHLFVPDTWLESGDRVLFVFPLLEGGSVAGLVAARGVLPVRVCAEILRQLLAALAVVHRAGAVHGAVTAENVRLAATLLGRPQSQLDGLGHPSEAQPSAASDLRAAGRVAALMLGGGPVAQGADWVATEECPEPLAELVADLLATDSTDDPEAALAAQARILRARLGWSDDIGEDAAIEIPPVVPPLPEPWRTRAAQASAGAAGEEGDEPESVTADPPEAEPTRAQVPEAIEPGAMVDLRRPAPTAASGARDAEPEGQTRAERRERATSAGPGARRGTARRGSRGRGGRGEGVLSRRGVWIGLIVVLVIVLALSVWRLAARGEFVGEGDAPAPVTTPLQAPSGSPSALAASGAAPSSAATPDGAATPTSPTPDATPSSGRIVISVGQPCQAIEVGHRETTLDGMTVTCTLRPDETYAWLR